MKKFIVFIITAIIATSFTAKAQYISKPQVPGEDGIVENLNTMTGNAFRKLNNGKSCVIFGACCELVGVATVFIPYFNSKNMENSKSVTPHYQQQTFSESSKQWGNTACYIIGGTIMAAGAIMETVGWYKIWDARLDLKGIRIAATATGFVVNF